MVGPLFGVGVAFGSFVPAAAEDVVLASVVVEVAKADAVAALGADGVAGVFTLFVLITDY